jgi:para-aminobenzoate synthetase component 1
LPRDADRDAARVVSVLSYDLKHWIERLSRRHAWPATPLLYCAQYDWCIEPDYARHAAQARAISAAALEEALAHLARAGEPAPRAAGERWHCPRPLLSAAQHLEGVERILAYIAAGDVYQVNFAQPFVATGGCGDGRALFARLRRDYPMPFGAYVDGGDFVLVSNSPECFLDVDGEAVATFPIKGTRALAGAVGQAGGLDSDPKERAEHVMIVDLERNDLGRVCRPGSVEVVTLGGVRRYPLLLHMESHVRGRLRPGVSLPDVIRASFPGGSITGAPKVRAMEIIEELEPAARGLYTGAVGWSDLSGRSRFNLAIRTAVLTGEQLTYWAGGGIVADSDPEREYEETLLKSTAVFRALAGAPQAP